MFSCVRALPTKKFIPDVLGRARKRFRWRTGGASDFRFGRITCADVLSQYFGADASPGTPTCSAHVHSKGICGMWIKFLTFDGNIQASSCSELPQKIEWSSERFAEFLSFNGQFCNFTNNASIPRTIGAFSWNWTKTRNAIRFYGIGHAETAMTGTKNVKVSRVHIKKNYFQGAERIG